MNAGLRSTGVGSVTPEPPPPRALLGPLPISWNPITTPKAAHRSTRTQILSQPNTTPGLERKGSLQRWKKSAITLTLAWDPGTLRMPSVSSPLFSKQDSNYQRKRSSLKSATAGAGIQVEQGVSISRENWEGENSRRTPSNNKVEPGSCTCCASDLPPEPNPQRF